MDDTTIKKIREAMLEEREGLVSQLTEMGVSPETGNPQDVDFEQGFADSGQSTAEKVRLLSIAEGLLEIVHEIDDALERMDEGTYGTCERCGTEIPPERLEARPYARECIACKQRG